MNSGTLVVIVTVLLTVRGPCAVHSGYNEAYFKRELGGQSGQFTYANTDPKDRTESVSYRADKSGRGSPLLRCAKDCLRDPDCRKFSTVKSSLPVSRSTLYYVPRMIICFLCYTFRQNA